MIKEAIKAMMKDQEELYSILGTVISVNGAFCDVSPVDGSADILDVRLQVEQSKGVLIKPKLDSKVIVSFLSKNEAIVSMFSTIDGIELNGNDWSTLKTEDFITEINKLKGLVDAMVQVFSSSWVPVAQDGGAALKTALASALAGKTTGDYSQLKNETVKHGEG